MVVMAEAAEVEDAEVAATAAAVVVQAVMAAERWYWRRQRWRLAIKKSQ